MDCSAKEGTGIAVLGESDCCHVGRAVYGGRGDLRGGHLSQIPGDLLLSLFLYSLQLLVLGSLVFCPVSFQSYFLPGNMFHAWHSLLSPEQSIIGSPWWNLANHTQVSFYILTNVSIWRTQKWAYWVFDSSLLFAPVRLVEKAAAYLSELYILLVTDTNVITYSCYRRIFCPYGIVPLMTRWWLHVFEIPWSGFLTYHQIPSWNTKHTTTASSELPFDPNSNISLFKVHCL